MNVEQVRGWFSRYHQALMVVAIAFMLYGQMSHQYWRASTGLTLAALVLWGRLGTFPASDRSWHRPFLATVMWGCIVVAVGAVAMAIWLHLHPQG